MSNAELLSRVDGWFHDKKTAPIRAKELTETTTISTIEGDVEANAGDLLCRGAAGEPWPQSPESVAKKYDSTDDIDADGFRLYTPKPDGEGVMAAEVNEEFTVQASWGELKGQPGDYVVKNFADRDVENPADVWIVARNLFQATYEAQPQG